ncbi:MAG: pilus assembly protein [Propionibacteriaceae bacterium]|jgi:Flp pilus assembly protein TadG|nr:pilus assembly protein [Propionibacteriaceae bacterium]
MRPPALLKGPRDAGSTTLETVILFPATLLLLCAAVQAGLWYHARAVCLAAAEEGARAGAVVDGSSYIAADTALSFMRRAAHGIVTDSGVIATRGWNEVEVTVVADGLSLVPGWTPHIAETARLPVERRT